MLAHLDAQRHERSAILADDPESEVSHLESAVENYESVEFERSLERVRENWTRPATPPTRPSSTRTRGRVEH